MLDGSCPVSIKHTTKQQGLLGAAGASLALIVSAPFAGVKEAPTTVAAPKSVKPAITKTVAKAPEKKVVEKKAPVVAAAPVKKAPAKKVAAPKGYNFDVETPVSAKKAAADAVSKERAAKAAEAKVRKIVKLRWYYDAFLFSCRAESLPSIILIACNNMRIGKGGRGCRDEGRC